MDSDLLERVTAFIAEHTSVPHHQVHGATRLAEDLGVAGADGWELVEAYAETFGVDIARFQCDPHFGPEVGSPLAGAVLGTAVAAGVAAPWTVPFSVVGLGVLYRWLMGRGRQSGPYTLTVADLSAYAETGSWGFTYA